VSESSHSDSDDSLFVRSAKRRNEGLQKKKSAGSSSRNQSGKNSAKRDSTSVLVGVSSKEPVLTSVSKDGGESQQTKTSTINSNRGRAKIGPNNVTVKGRFGRSANKEPPPFDDAVPLTKQYVGVARNGKASQFKFNKTKEQIGLLKGKKLSLSTKKST